MLIHKNDRVVLLKDITYTRGDSGRESEERNLSKKGDVSRVLRVMRGKGQVIVEGVNYRKRAQRPTQEAPRGGWIRKEMPIDISNVGLYCAECGRGVRVRRNVNEHGKKERLCAKERHVIPFPASS